jgi:SPX domain protein involved in polyphosphate accumulation
VAGNELACSQRFEYKYLLSERQAELVRGFAWSHLVPDTHADPRRGNEYPVYSLYLDSRDLRLYRSSATGEMNRFKLRARWYDGSPDSPVFLEVKARRNDAVVKHRGAVRKDRVERAIHGFCVVAEDQCEADGCDAGAAERFVELCSQLLARPMLIVRYEREAYVAPEGRPLRLTMDRRIACLRTDAARPACDGPGWVELEGPQVVLEVKFNDTFPAWAGDMVRSLSLVRTSMPKYVKAVDTLSRWGMGFA